MFIRNCSCLLVSVLLHMICLPAHAQQGGALYIQSEYEQPYELMLNGKTYASSATGYLFIPQTNIGKQKITIRVTGEITSEYQFEIETGEQPRGFSIRQGVDNSWSLFDMVDLTTLQGTAPDPVAKTEPVLPVNTVMIKVPENQTIEKIPVKFIETPAVKETTPAPVKQKMQGITGILKIFDKSSSGGIDQVYVLSNGTQSDTIALFIPVLNEEIPKSGTSPSVFVSPAPAAEIIHIAFISTTATRKRYPLLSKQLYDQIFPGTVL